jgi:transcriptional regulator with XRE-family HTH domain
MAVEKSAATRALGEAIRAARLEQGFSQEAFAAHVALDRSSTVRSSAARSTSPSARS